MLQSVARVEQPLVVQVLRQIKPDPVGVDFTGFHHFVRTEAIQVREGDFADQL